jgi:hypothetical protein
MLLLTMPQCLMLVITAGISAFTPGFYAVETPNWQAQAIGQDIIDLFLVAPLLIVGITGMWYGNKVAFVLWGGVNLYLVYTYVIFCFSIHFNQWFIVYCLLLGISFYSFLFFVYIGIIKSKLDFQSDKMPVKFTGWYFIVIAVVFSFLWLSEIVPSLIAGHSPESLRQSGLFTNPVHIIDLSIILPGIFLCGCWLLMQKQPAYILSAVLLVFFVIMNITIAVLMLVMANSGFAANYILVGIMSVLTVISLLLFLRISNALK